MARDIRRKGHERSELSWQPELCWQILRRTPAYIKAFNAFNNSLILAKDYSSKKFVELYSQEASFSNFGPDRVWDFHDRNEIIEKYEHLEIGEMSKTNFYRSILEHDYRGEKKFNFGSDYYKDFYSLYGDIIRFPINPKTEIPNPIILKAIWTYKPISLVSFNFMNEVFESHGFESNKNVKKSYGKTSMSYHLIAINSNHSLASIKKELSCYVEEYFGIGKKVGKGYDWDLEEFHLMLRISDVMREHELSGEKITPKEIIEKTFFGSNISYRSKVSKVYELTKKFNKMVNLFSREPKKYSKKRRFA